MYVERSPNAPKSSFLDFFSPVKLGGRLPHHWAGNPHWVGVENRSRDDEYPSIAPW